MSQSVKHLCGFYLKFASGTRRQGKCLFGVFLTEIVIKRAIGVDLRTVLARLQGTQTANRTGSAVALVDTWSTGGSLAWSTVNQTPFLIGLLVFRSKLVEREGIAGDVLVGNLSRLEE